MYKGWVCLVRLDWTVSNAECIYVGMYVRNERRKGDDDKCQLVVFHGFLKSRMEKCNLYSRSQLSMSTSLHTSHSCMINSGLSSPSYAID